MKKLNEKSLTGLQGGSFLSGFCDGITLGASIGAVAALAGATLNVPGLIAVGVIGIGCQIIEL